MAGTNLMDPALVSSPRVLYSGQLADTNEDTLYTAPAGGSCVLRHGTLTNVTGAAVNISLSILKAGQTAGSGQHRILYNYALPAGDTLSLLDYLGGACLGPGDFVTGAASVASAIDVVISGVENS